MHRFSTPSLVWLLTASLGMLPACGDDGPVACSAPDPGSPPDVRTDFCVDLDPAWAADAGVTSDASAPANWTVEGSVVEIADPSASSRCNEEMTSQYQTGVDWFRMTDGSQRAGVVALRLPEPAARPAPGDVLKLSVRKTGSQWGNTYAHYTVLLNGKLLGFRASSYGDASPMGAAELSVAAGSAICRGSDGCGTWDELEAVLKYGGQQITLAPGTGADLGPLTVYLSSFSETKSVGACQDWDATSFSLSGYMRKAR